MRYLTRGSFGVVLAIGGAFAIGSAMRDELGAASVVGLVTIVIALVVFLRVDRKRT